MQRSQENYGYIPSPEELVHGSKKSRFGRNFWFDLIVKGMLIASLWTTDFLLYAASANYSIFSFAGFPEWEVLNVFLLIVAFSFVSVFLLSFSAVLQNLWLSFSTATFLTVFMVQFATFDETSIFNKFVNGSISHGLLVLIITALFFAILLKIKRVTLLYCSFAVFLLFCAVTVNIYTGRFSSVSGYENMSKTMSENKTVAEDELFVYITVPSFAGYAALQDLLPDENSKKDNTIGRLTDFLNENSFKLYKNAYVPNSSSVANLIKAYNMEPDKIAENYINTINNNNSYWKFKVRNGEKAIKMTENQLLTKLQQDGFETFSYMDNSVNVCQVFKAGGSRMNKCYVQKEFPFELSSFKFSQSEKIVVLVAKWLESMNLFTNLAIPYKMLLPLIDIQNMPIWGKSFTNISVLNSLEAVDLAIQNLSNTKGKQAHFINLAVLDDLYIYDEFCNIKPYGMWKNKENLPWVSDANTFVRREAYFEQMSCMIGKLESLMRAVKEANLDSNATIIIQGSSGVAGLQNKLTKNFIDIFKGEQMVILAVKDNKTGSFSTVDDICSTNHFLGSYMFNYEPCDGTDVQMHDDAINQLKERLSTYFVLTDWGRTAEHLPFEEWYQRWNKVNEANQLLKEGKGASAAKNGIGYLKKIEDIPEMSVFMPGNVTKMNKVSEQTSIKSEK